MKSRHFLLHVPNIFVPTENYSQAQSTAKISPNFKFLQTCKNDILKIYYLNRPIRFSINKYDHNHNHTIKLFSSDYKPGFNIYSEYT